jgi:hypothetical protein
MIKSIKKNFQNNSGQIWPESGQIWPESGQNLARIWPESGQILAQTGLTGNNAFSYKNN